MSGTSWWKDRLVAGAVGAVVLGGAAYYLYSSRNGGHTEKKSPIPFTGVPSKDSQKASKDGVKCCGGGSAPNAEKQQCCPPKKQCCPAKSEAAPCGPPKAVDQLRCETQTQGIEVGSMLVVAKSFASSDPGRLSVNQGAHVRVLNNCGQGWVFVEAAPGVSGFIPEACCGASVGVDSASKATLFKVTRDYVPNGTHGRLAVRKGDAVTLVSRAVCGRYVFCRQTGQAGDMGFIPVDCVEEVAGHGGGAALGKVLRDVKADGPGRISVQEGEAVDVLSKSAAFVFCRRADGAMGHVPADAVVGSVTAPDVGTPRKSCTAVADYAADAPGRLCVKKGDKLWVVSSSNRWLFCESAPGVSGHVPRDVVDL